MVFSLFRRKKPAAKRQSHTDRGFLVFENTSEVIRAEKTLKDAGFAVSVSAPPPDMRQGCDLVVEYPLVEAPNVLRRLEGCGLTPLLAVPMSGPHLEPVSLYQVKDFGEHLMVRAANMKMTVEKRSLRIVNVSGGGCPDVPALAEQLVGRHLAEVASPRETGHTLCGYALGLAYEELKRLCLP
ncbi:DUF3343 domain-containing protein [Fundidesulfovibrio butyratiphilus]